MVQLRTWYGVVREAQLQSAERFLRNLLRTCAPLLRSVRLGVGLLSVGCGSTQLGLDGLVDGGTLDSGGGLTIEGGGGEAMLTIEPLEASFGTVGLGRMGPERTFTVKNAGASASGLPMVSVSPDFSQTNTCSAAPIAAGETCTISVVFRPTTRGPKSGTVTVSAAPGGTAMASVTGSVVTPDALLLSPTLTVFPDTAVMEMSPARQVTFTNEGEAIMDLTVTVASTDFFAPMPGNRCAAAALPPGAKCTIDVVFRPQSRGDKNAMVTVTATGRGSVSAGLRGRGT